MKKFISSAVILTIAAASLYAVSPGEKISEPKSKLQWINCSPMPLGRLDAKKHKDVPALRAVVFMYTRAEDSDRTIAMLEDIRTMYQNKLLITAITPDTEADAETFRKRHRDSRIRFAVDTERRITPDFMRDTVMLFPMAFLIDNSGMVLWRGEAADLPEMIQRHFNGKLDVDMNKLSDPVIYKTQQSVRDGNLFKVWENALEVLEKDPSNPSALRLAVFAAENINLVQRAWDTVSGIMTKCPDLPRIYFTALDLTMRHRTLRKNLPQLISRFAEHPFDSAMRCAFADALLNNFPFDSAAVLGAGKIIAGTPMPINAMPGQIAYLLAVRSRLHYAFGDVESAAADIAEAAALWKNSGAAVRSEQAKMQLDFYHTLLKHRPGAKK